VRRAAAPSQARHEPLLLGGSHPELLAAVG
jgi:hypothetical protein